MQVCARLCRDLFPIQVYSQADLRSRSDEDHGGSRQRSSSVRRANSCCLANRQLLLLKVGFLRVGCSFPDGIRAEEKTFAGGSDIGLRDLMLTVRCSRQKDAFKEAGCCSAVYDQNTAGGVGARAGGECCIQCAALVDGVPAGAVDNIQTASQGHGGACCVAAQVLGSV